VTVGIVPDSTEESETERDGLLSTLTEWHALVGGLVVGVVAAGAGSWELAVLWVTLCLGAKMPTRYTAELRREPPYALGGCAVGAVAARAALWVVL
jgi:hypothetical protein